MLTCATLLKTELPEGSFNTNNRAMVLAVAVAAALAAVLVPGAFAMPAVKASTVADVIKNHANLTSTVTVVGQRVGAG